MTSSQPLPEPAIGLPLGVPVDVAPAHEPKAVALQGRYGRVEKLDALRHSADLWAALAGHDQVWTYLSYGPFAEAEAFGSWLAARATTADPFCYVVIDNAGRACGILSLMSIQPDMRVIEVGHVLLSPVLQRTPLATEVQYLLARYAFETLGYRRYEWKCNALNAASRRASVRLGFEFEGVFPQHLIVKGRNRDTAWYGMLDRDWPARKRAFERWLAPENFDADGRQKVRLSHSSGGNKDGAG